MTSQISTHITGLSFFVWFDSLRPINNLSVIKGQIFLGWTSTKLRINVLAQGYNAVTLVRLEPAAPLSRVKHSTTEPMRFLDKLWKTKTIAINQDWVYNQSKLNFNITQLSRFWCVNTQIPSLSCDCCVTLLAVPQVCLQFVIVVFPDLTIFVVICWERADFLARLGGRNHPRF